MKRGYIITVRSSSNRLPEKCFRTVIPGVSLLEFLIERVKKKVKPNQIIIATTKEEEDDLIEEVARFKSVRVFRGSKKNKIERWIGAASAINADILICCDGDDPLVDIDIGNYCADLLEKNNACIVEAINLPCGSFTYAIRKSSLERVHFLFDTSDSEMMWAFFDKDPDTKMIKYDCKFSDKDLIADQIRITVDYQEDLNMIRKLVKILSDRKLEGNAKEIFHLAKEFPNLFLLNKFRQKEFKLNQKKQINSYNISK